MHPLVSVIIPVFNGGEYLRQCLLSVTDQTYQNLEIIVIDDGSTDDSSALVEEIGDCRIKIHRQPNQGRCSARNVGLRLANGTLLKYLDQDDVLDTESIRLQVEDLGGEHCDVISVGTLSVFETDVASAARFEFFERFPRYSDPVQFCALLGEHALQTSVWMTPRSLHLKGGYWNEELAENPMDDGELFTRILMNAQAVKYCSGSMAYHRISRGDRGSRHCNSRRIVSYFRSLELCSGYLLARENSARTREMSARMFKHYLYMHFGFDRKLRTTAFRRMKELGYPRVAYYIGGPFFRALDRFVGPWIALHVRWWAQKTLCSKQQVYGHKLHRHSKS